MTEPIVPVRRNGSVDPWWRQVVSLAHVEGLVNVDAGVDNAAALAASMQLPVVPLATIDREGHTRWTTHPTTLARGDSTQAPVLACTDSQLWQAVVAGDLTVDHEEHLQQESISFHRPSTADQVARAALRRETLLDRTVEWFGEYRASGGVWAVPALVWVTKRDSIRDCLFFWNLRALRSLRLDRAPMLLLPSREVEDWIDFSQEFAAELARPDEFAPDVIIASLTATEEELHLLAAGMDLTRSDEEVRVGHRWPAPIRTPPFTYRTNIDPRQWLVFDREYGESVDVEVHPVAGRASVRFDSPVPFIGNGYTLLRLRSSMFDGLLHRPSIATKIVSNAEWRDGAVQIATHTTSHYQFEIQIPSLEESVHTLLTERTVRYELSDKGRLAAAIMTDADIGALLAPGMYEAITGLTTPRSRDLERELRAMRERGDLDNDLVELAMRWGGRAERRYRSAAELSSLLGPWAVATLEQLCALTWAERGVETDCARCGLRSFVPLRRVDREARCSGCRAASAHTATAKAVTVYYRLDTFIDRASDQGVLPHLLVVAALRERSPHTHLLGGANVVFAGDEVGEIDIVGAHAGQIVAGEVKTSAHNFTTEQIARDISMSVRLGADSHILATVEKVSAATIASARAAANQAGIDLLILGGDELRPRG